MNETILINAYQVHHFEVVGRDTELCPQRARVAIRWNNPKLLLLLLLLGARCKHRGVRKMFLKQRNAFVAASTAQLLISPQVYVL